MYRPMPGFPRARLGGGGSRHSLPRARPPRTSRILASAYPSAASAPAAPASPITMLVEVAGRFECGGAIWQAVTPGNDLRLRRGPGEPTKQHLTALQTRAANDGHDCRDCLHDRDLACRSRSSPPHPHSCGWGIGAGKAPPEVGDPGAGRGRPAPGTLAIGTGGFSATSPRARRAALGASTTPLSSRATPRRTSTRRTSMRHTSMTRRARPSASSTSASAAASASRSGRSPARCAITIAPALTPAVSPSRGSRACAPGTRRARGRCPR